jgi:hypothetical protein
MRRSVLRMSSHIYGTRVGTFLMILITRGGWQLWFCKQCVNQTFLKPFRVPSRTFPICRSPLIRISILSKGDLCVVALPNCGSKWMTTVCFFSTVFCIEVRFSHGTHLLLLLAACPTRSLCGKLQQADPSLGYTTLCHAHSSTLANTPPVPFLDRSRAHQQKCRRRSRKCCS